MVWIRHAEYDPRWPQLFEEQRARLRAALGARAGAIEHIGSTSVTGLAAKPIVDLIVAGIAPDDEAARLALEDAGYRVTVDEPGHRIYEPPALDVHVHLWSDPNDVERHLVFRDWLREHPEDRTLYEHVKRRLAQRPWQNSNDYAEAKTAVIETITRRARGMAAGPRVDRFAVLILERLPAQSRVLEIGAGEGLLAERLAAAGHDVVALDTALRSTFPVVLTRFEEYDAPAGSFDCVAAQLVLHHAGDLEATLEKVRRLVRPDGIVAIDDYGWERSDDPAFRADRNDLHRSDDMLRALRARFEQIAYFDHAYHGDGAGSDAIAFTFLGAPHRNTG